MLRLDPTHIPVVLDAVEQVLGATHPVAQLVRLCAVDEDMKAETWSAIEALPEDQRRAIAGITAAYLVPEFMTTEFMLQWLLNDHDR